MSDHHLPTNDEAESEKQQPRLARRRLLATGVWATTSLVGLTLSGIGGRFVVGDALNTPEAQWVKVGEVASLPTGQMHQAAYTLHRKDAWRTTEEQGLLYVFSTDGAAYTVLSAVCTHLGCNVHWAAESSQFHCPCHDAAFSQSGAVLSGPPRRALTQLEAEVDNGILMVKV